MKWRICLWGFILLSISIGMIFAVVKFPSDEMHFEPAFRVEREYIKGVSWHPSSERLAVYTLTGTWIYNNRLEDIIYLPEAKIASFSPDGNFLVGVSDSHAVTLWNGYTFELISKLPRNQTEVKGLTWRPTNPDELIIIDREGHLQQWSASQNALKFYSQIDLKFGEGQIPITWNVLGNRLALLDDDLNLMVWNLDLFRVEFQKQFELSSKTNSTAIKWLDNTVVFVLAEVWDVRTGERLSGNLMEEVTHLQSPNQQWQANLTGNTLLEIYSTADDLTPTTYSLEVPFSGNLEMAWAADSQHLLMFDSKSVLYMFDTQTQQLVTLSPN